MQHLKMCPPVTDDYLLKNPLLRIIQEVLFSDYFELFLATQSAGKMLAFYVYRNLINVTNHVRNFKNTLNVNISKLR